MLGAAGGQAGAASANTGGFSALPQPGWTPLPPPAHRSALEPGMQPACCPLLLLLLSWLDIPTQGMHASRSSAVARCRAHERPNRVRPTASLLRTGRSWTRAAAWLKSWRLRHMTPISRATARSTWTPLRACWSQVRACACACVIVCVHVHAHVHFCFCAAVRTEGCAGASLDPGNAVQWYSWTNS